ncbi:MAG: hypothetical protein AAFR17_10535 [Pseudomonadota bacterium]
MDPVQIALEKAGGVTAADMLSLGAFDVRIHEAGERIDRTVSGVRARHLHAMPFLSPAQRHAGQTYGGVMEALTLGIGGSGFDPGAAIPGPRGLGSYLKPLEMGILRDLAHEAVPRSRIALEPTRIRGKPSKGSADLGKRHVGRVSTEPKDPALDKRRAIMARDLLDLVCISGHSLSAVLKVHRWYDNGGNRSKLQTAFGALLDDLAHSFNGRDAAFAGGWSHDISP